MLTNLGGPPVGPTFLQHRFASLCFYMCTTAANVAPMTSEICLMNRYAVVLAADSAATVSHWDPQQQRSVERYFKGSNKIFQLSVHQPVGLMINGIGSLHGVPWEVIAKEFRKTLGAHSSPGLQGYAQAFFDFVRVHQHLFRPEQHEENFLRTATIAGLSVFWDADRNDPRIQKAGSEDERKGAYRSIFDERRDDLSKVALNDKHFRAEDVQAAIAAYSERLIAWLEPHVGPGTEHVSDLDLRELASFAIEAVFKNYRSMFESTGIVLAGYGEQDFFPTYSEHDCYGFLLNFFLVDDKTEGRVTPEIPAIMAAFAQSSMVDTFAMGLSADVFGSARMHTRQALAELVERLQKEAGAEIPNAATHMAQIFEAHAERLVSDCRTNHREPLFRVIGSLPVSEMAELAETLIALQSLKEKVTRPSESVGGPVDVAVITRSEGLVWVKRKHFFPAELNAGFFLRQQREYEE